MVRIVSIIIDFAVLVYMHVDFQHRRAVELSSGAKWDSIPNQLELLSIEVLSR